VPGSHTLECPIDPSPEIWGYANSTDPSYTTSYTDLYTYSDNCALNNKLYYYIYRTWTITDLCGNRTGFQVLSVKDNTAPVITQLSNLILECDKVPDLSPLPDSQYIIKATALDSCIGPINVTLTETQPWKNAVDAGTVPVCATQILNSRNTTRVYSVVDTCGNTASLTQTITFTDTKAPVWVKAPRVNVSSLELPKGSICILDDIIAMIGNLDTNITWADNCQSNPIKQFLDGLLDKPCDQIVYSWKLIDWCNNINDTNIIVGITGKDPLSGASDFRPWSYSLVLLFWIFHLLRQK